MLKASGLLRTITERLTRGMILKRRMIVNGKNCTLLISPDAQLKYLKFGRGAFDQDLIGIAEKYVHSKSNVWDIGANVGVFTFASASIATEGAVLSVEADIWLAGILRKTGRRSMLRRCKIILLKNAGRITPAAKLQQSKCKPNHVGQIQECDHVCHHIVIALAKLLRRTSRAMSGVPCQLRVAPGEAG